MNFVAASLVYHASPDIAFILLVKLMEKKIRTNYSPGLQGLLIQYNEIDNALRLALPSLHMYLTDVGLLPSMYATELIMGLFGSTLPLDTLSIFYDNFIKLGWVYFHNVVVGMFRAKEREIMGCEDLSDILILLKKITQPPTK
jgi:hypothetical protein